MAKIESVVSALADDALSHSFGPAVVDNPFKNSDLSPISGKIEESFKASKSPQIYDPKPLLQRPFHDDYPQGTGRPDGSRITTDLDGRPIADTAIIAGRRVGGGGDEGLSRVDTNRIARALGLDTEYVPRSGPELKGDAGRYVRNGPDKQVFVDNALEGDKRYRVFQHELGHAIDDQVFGLIGPGGAKIPTDGLSKELGRIYEDLNTAGWFKPGRGRTPQGQGYAANVTDAERMAEAIRAYMHDPNYIKSVAPKTAARIREYVNTNPNLNKAIHFNSAAPIGAAALGYDQGDR